MTSRISILGSCVLAVFATGSVRSTSSERDLVGHTLHVTARIAGIVVTTDTPPQAVRRAIVSLYGGERALGYHTITDHQGHFEFNALPSGRFELSAAKPSYVTITYGATRPGRPGTPLSIETGQQMTDVRVLLARGGVITGTVRETTGEPIASLDVHLEARGITANRPTTATVTTDDQGVYRFFGLAPGTYLVSARPRPTSGELQPATDEEVERALRELQLRAGVTRVATSGPVPATGVSPAVAPSASVRSYDLVPVYHPSAFASEDAVPVAVRAGEERGAVDVTLRMMSTAVIEGRIDMIEAATTSEIQVTLTRASSSVRPVPRTTSLRSDGTFRFASVPPGRYQLAARAVSHDAVRSSLGSTPSGTTPGPGRPCLFASSDVVISGDDVTGLSLGLRPCLRIAGRLELAADSTLARPANFSGVRVTLQPDTSQGAPVFVPPRVPAELSSDGRFLLGEFGELLPGKYHFTVALPDSEPGRRWWVQSAIADGRDSLDMPLELTEASPPTTQVMITLTDKHTSLSGVLTTPSGRAAVDYTVIVFTTNRDWWRAPFRRVRTARPANSGEYLFQDLPPGEYYLAALTELAPDDWRDPGFLDQIVGASTRIAIGPGEHKVQSFTIGGIGSNRR